MILNSFQQSNSAKNLCARVKKLRVCSFNSGQISWMLFFFHSAADITSAPRQQIQFVFQPGGIPDD